MMKARDLQRRLARRKHRSQQQIAGQIPPSQLPHWKQQF
jgi:hypothetical protein